MDEGRESHDEATGRFPLRHSSALRDSARSLIATAETTTATTQRKGRGNQTLILRKRSESSSSNFKVVSLRQNENSTRLARLDLAPP